MDTFKEFHEKRLLSEGAFVPLLLKLASAARAGAPVVLKFGKEIAKRAGGVGKNVVNNPVTKNVAKGAGTVTKNVAKGTGKAVRDTGKSLLDTAGKNAVGIGIGAGAYDLMTGVGKNLTDSIEDTTEYVKSIVDKSLDEETIKALAENFTKLKLTVPAIIAVLAGGLVLKKFLQKNKNKPKNISRAGNTYHYHYNSPPPGQGSY